MDDPHFLLTINKNPLTALKFDICVEKLFSQDTSSYPTKTHAQTMLNLRGVCKTTNKGGIFTSSFWKKWTGPPSEPRQKPSYFPLYWLFNRGPYYDLL